LRILSGYPTIRDVKHILRHSLYAPRVQVIVAYVLGSEARGTAKENRNLDIGIVIPTVRGKSSLKFTENYHNKFSSDAGKPHWKGRRIDFQFFYPADDISDYNKIELEL